MSYLSRESMIDALGKVDADLLRTEIELQVSGAPHRALHAMSDFTLQCMLENIAGDSAAGKQVAPAADVEAALASLRAKIDARSAPASRLPYADN